MGRQTITLRLTIVDPVPGVRYSLQDKDGPVGAVTARDAPLSLDAPVLLHDDDRLTGPFIRREGADRRFIYIGIGQHAGDADSAYDRRAKIDVHDIPAALLALARAGQVLEARLPGRGRDGSPACAAVKPLSAWAAL